MNRKNLLRSLVIFYLIIGACIVLNAQQVQSTYDVVAGDGNGLRFWQSDNYKIHMGTTAEYQYGPVTGYSIKTNMNNDPSRGWTWGVSGQTPVLAVNTAGMMQLAGDLSLGTTNNFSGRFLRVGFDASPSFPLNFSGEKSGFGSFWDTDGIFVGLVNGGTNRKDAVIAWGDDGDDLLRFVFNGNDMARINASGNMAIGTTDFGVNTRLKVYESGSSAGTWRGRIVSSGQNAAVVMGEVDNKACIGAHNPALTAWDDLIIQNGGGRVGVGTANPTAKLEVAGPSTGGGVTLRVGGGGDLMLNSGGSVFFDGNYSYATGNYIRPIASNTQAFFTGGVERLRIAANGNIGIGSSSPNEKLTVNGKVYAKEVKVDLNVPGPDYVFEPDYKLTPLDTVAAYIRENKHLPEVPSAKQMEKDGIDIGEMNMILLKKIEELTLHLIAKEKHIQNLEVRIQNLEQK